MKVLKLIVGWSVEDTPPRQLFAVQIAGRLDPETVTRHRARAQEEAMLRRRSGEQAEAIELVPDGPERAA